MAETEHRFTPVPNQTGCASCGYSQGHHPTARTLRRRTDADHMKRNETAQRAADTMLEFAQYLETTAKRYRTLARGYRSGEFDPAYSNLPADAGDHMRHPAQRAIDHLSAYEIRETVERLGAELKG